MSSTITVLKNFKENLLKVCDMKDLGEVKTIIDWKYRNSKNLSVNIYKEFA